MVDILIAQVAEPPQHHALVRQIIVPTVCILSFSYVALDRAAHADPAAPVLISGGATHYSGRGEQILGI